MDRIFFYPSEIPATDDMLGMQVNTMRDLGRAFHALTGGATTVDGVDCTQTSPPTMAVNLSSGWIFYPTVVDSTAFGLLPADITGLMKAGGVSSQTMPIAAPTEAGMEVVYLLEAAGREYDNDPTVLFFRNSANPNMPLSGPANSGQPLNKLRSSVCALQLKAGAPAPVGQAVAPPVDAGWVPLWLITVSNGALSITSANIKPAPGAPRFKGSLSNALGSGDLSGYATHAEVNNESAARVAADAVLQIEIDTKHVGWRNLQVFTINSAWVVPDNVDRVRVTIVGGGAGAGSSGSTLAGGGGGAGATGIAVVAGLTPGTSIPMTIGAAGNGGLNGAQGAAGGSSSFGVYVTSGGGSPGQGGNTGQGGGAGGPAYGATLTVGGGAGGDGSSGLNRGGDGAASSFGGGGRASSALGVVQNGVAWGSGGGAGYFNSNVPGGSGQQGIIVVEW